MGKGVSQQPTGAGPGPDHGVRSAVQQHPSAEDALSGGSLVGTASGLGNSRRRTLAQQRPPVCQWDTLASAEIAKSRMERGDLGIKAVKDYGCLCLSSFPFQDYCSPHSPYDRDSCFMAANHKCLHLRQHSLLPFTFFGGRTSSKIRKLHIPVRKSQVENEKLTWHSAHMVPASL